MDNSHLNAFLQNPETFSPYSSITRGFDSGKCDLALNQDNPSSAMDEGEEESFADLMLCDSNSRLIPSGFSKSNCTDEIVMFINAGGEALYEADSSMKLLGDTYFEGGDVMRTNEPITEAGDCPFIYWSARIGSFSYQFNNLPPGDYIVDLHFAEIINTNGPKGMRVFNAYMQERQVLSDFDIFSVVGANKPLQVVDLRVSVKEDGLIALRFEGVSGSPMVCGICVRKAQNTPVTQGSQEYLKCNSCAAEIELSSAQMKLVRTKATDKYEKKIQELTTQCQLKTHECHEAWMSLTAANEQLEKVRMQLDNKIFQTRTLDETVGKQAENLKNITSSYDLHKKHWEAAINNLQEKIKIMKREHAQLSHEAHACVESIPELNKMVTGVQALVLQCEDLKVKYSEEQAKRKDLYNQIQDTKGNIRVFCRCRPLSKQEISAGFGQVVDFDAAKDGDLGILTGASTKKTFKFDRVYTPKDNQVDVFADALPLVTSVLDGYNVCIFAYGQTGTGKTFTMEGTEQNRGVNYRTLKQLFQIAKERIDSFIYNISVSVLEVYNEQIRDLLSTSPTSKRLEIKQSAEGFHHVPGIVQAQVENIKEVWDVLQIGSNSRAVGSNNVNEHSSRSHCMLCVMVKSKNLMTGECTKSKLWLVDLAGSERLAKTDAQGERLKEAQNINKSLSALGDVIYALATKSSHIPYRNSKLTHLLQDSLGGDSKTLMFVQISPSETDLNETLSSLNFATRVRGVELGPAKRQVDTSELQKMKTMLERARQESRSKDESLRKLEESLQNLENKAKGRDQVYKTLQEKIKELEGQLELKTSMHNQSEKQLSQLSDRLKGKEEVYTALQQKAKELEAKLKDRQQSDSTSYQQKVKDLENKMKERVQESESHSLALVLKIKELERKLKEQEENKESILRHQKIKELEARLKEQEQQLQGALARDFSNAIMASPSVGKCRREDESMNEAEPHILRSSNSTSSRPLSRGSKHPRVSDLIHETRRKRYSRSGETENNNMVIPASLADKRARKSDPPKVARVVKTAKPGSIAAAQGRGTLGHKKVMNRAQVQAAMEIDTKKKIWSR
ncbi:LOW QUALITY PROTEIN: kinesin-like protein KIN-14R [Hibiscus syriacus]|uniref:LOW QUALITY PROTEIN: kinesin-like protein KIN-14R n=1 Tax=Hibiscus syriacus TaxID=106335 RepID=UPI001924AE1B|nr:LOW QUALITY PROTEIN: kinesin-like protein KIN-14R [Hibiscus syriacus]